MKYYIYIIDLDVMDKIKEMKDNEEEKMLILKTNGRCVLEYTKEEYETILKEIGDDNVNILQKKFLSLIDIRKLYDNVKLSDNNGYLREFKLKIYPAISECKGIVVLKQEQDKKEQKRKWFEFWKK